MGLAEDDDSFGAELAPGAAIAADPLHVIGLLADSCDVDPSDRRPLHETEEFPDSGGTGPEGKDPIDDLSGELEQKVLGKGGVAVQV